MKKPDFFIVGAPKCGTTAMYEYLKEHPQVFMPRKELYFFCRDLTFTMPPPTIEYYLSLFEPAGKEKRVGEASVWYLYSKQAPELIKKFNPDAKIIIMLRNPADVAYSLYHQHLFSGNEIIQPFEKALALEASRKKGENLPRLLTCPVEGLMYSEVGLYYEHVKRYLNTFDTKNIKIILFEDFTKDPEKSFEEVLNFLDLTSFTPDFKKVNANKTVRASWFRDMIKNRSKSVILASKILLPSRSLREKVFHKLWNLNTKSSERPPLKPVTRRRLQHIFLPDVKKLSSLLRRNLESLWKMTSEE